MSLHHRQPTNSQVDSASDLYTLVAGREPGTRVDCASCATRHERDALTWFQLPDSSDWLMAALCKACAAKHPALVEFGIYQHRPPVREATSGWSDGEVTTFLVCDPDFAMDRAS
jgi:hypothetical protein